MSRATDNSHDQSGWACRTPLLQPRVREEVLGPWNGAPAKLRLLATRDRFICEAVLEGGYRASEVAEFLGCHPSNVSRALQKNLAS